MSFVRLIFDNETNYTTGYGGIGMIKSMTHFLHITLVNISLNKKICIHRQNSLLAI